MASDFIVPEFLEDCDADTIHARMMDELPNDIDKTEGGFPWDFTRPTALIASELLQFYIPEAIKLMFPQWSSGSFLDYLAAGSQTKRKASTYAEAELTLTGEPGTIVPAGTVFATEAKNDQPSIEFAAVESCILNEEGKGTVLVRALLDGKQSNVNAGTKFKMSDVIDGAGDSTHPAFIVNGKEVPGIWISKYQNIVNNGRAYSLPGQDPTVNITWDTARGYCESKGKGWHMMTKAEWAAIMLWCKKNGFQPWGNNNYGKDSRETLQQAIPATYGSGTDAGKIYHVLTGTGPLTWSHNKQLDGIWDLNGNVSEWTGALRTVKGELQLLENNNGANSDNPQTAASSAWKAIDATTGAFITPDGNGTTANSIKIDATGAGGAQWCKTITKTSENFSCALGALTCSADISDAAKAVLRAYGLLPVDGAKASDYDDDRLWFNNVADERLFVSGGYYGVGASAGVGCSGVSWASRGSVSAHIGWRSTYVDLESVGL